MKCVFQKLFIAVSLTYLGLLILGCSSSKGLNKNSDYQLSKTYMKLSAFNSARLSYPKQERGGFISLTEKSWLRLLSGKSTPLKEIKAMGEQLPEKEMTVLSDEASYFFYQKTADGYFPAEHEVIVFHLISAMSLLKQKNLESAHVEAKKAAFYLQDDYTGHAGAFDDPLLRVWLASIWVALGEWQPAQVDLRRAAELSREYKWAKDLANKQVAPKRWIVVLQGTGPEIKWEPSGFQEHWTGLGSVKFYFPKSLETRVRVDGEVQETFSMQLSGDMYQRHQRRNAKIREALETSDYMLRSSSVHLGAGTAKGFGKVANGTFKVIGLAVGGAIIGGTIYVLAQSGASSSGTGELAALGVGLGVGSFKALSDAGSDIDAEVSKSADKSVEQALDLSETYRFVRFIPDQLHLGIGDNIGGDVILEIPGAGEEREPFLSVKSESSRVDFLFQPL